MTLFHFFFPPTYNPAQQAKDRARARSRARRARSRIRAMENERLDERFQQIEDDLGFVALVLGSVLQRLDEKGTVTRDEVEGLIHELDAIDGVQDGKLDISVLRGTATDDLDVADEPDA